ncbi:hypothetical protein LJK88_35660 [Paenibacillus sp. P26]|nr:hypothetical protein LJK88_35660 [Paenibacillus sp. P26]
MKSIRKLWIAALFIGLLGAGAAFQFYSHRASAEESSAGARRRQRRTSRFHPAI